MTHRLDWCNRLINDILKNKTDMQRYFEVRVRCNKPNDSGIERPVTEVYLAEALSCTEAEAVATRQLAPQIHGDFVISSVKCVRLSDVFPCDANRDKWYRFKSNLISLDEKTGTEKRTPSFSLVNADSLEESLSLFKVRMNGTIVDYELVSISETQILEVWESDVQTTISVAENAKK